MKKAYNSFLSLVLLCNLSACAARTNYWKDELPDHTSHLSAQEKAEIYDKFKIEELTMFSPSSIFSYPIQVIVQGKSYSILNYYPTMLKADPKLELDLEEVKSSMVNQYWIFTGILSLALAPLLLVEAQNITDNDVFLQHAIVAVAIQGAAFAIGLGFLFWQYNQYNNIKDRYNAALKAYLNDKSYAPYSQMPEQPQAQNTNVPTWVQVGWVF